MNDATLRILAPTRYQWRFNSPRASRHKIHNRTFLPFEHISRWSKLEGFTVINPLPPRRFDLVHAYNRIPLGVTPFLIGFESHLPRAFGHEDSGLFRAMTRMLASRRCLRIVAISQFAKRQFLRQHADDPALGDLRSKLEVRYPSIPMPAGPDAFMAPSDARIRLLFVGHHFARKGGCVALRIADIAHRRGWPISVDIVSSLIVGAKSWVDPTRPDFFQPYVRLMHALPNVTYRGALPNPAILDLMRTAHFVLLPTFSDTFGYSAIEAMANHTPVVGTSQGALPEFIKDGENGLLLPLDRNDAGEWKHAGRTDRGEPAYEALFTQETDRLADQAIDRIAALVQSGRYAALRANARATAQAMFDADAANAYWDTLYTRVHATSAWRTDATPSLS